MARSDELVLDDGSGTSPVPLSESADNENDESLGEKAVPEQSGVSSPEDDLDADSDESADTTQPAPVDKARLRRRRINRFAEILTTVVAAALTICTLLSVSALAYDRVQSAKIPPNIAIGSVQVGGLTRDEARSAVAAKVAAISERKLYLNAAGQTFAVSLADLSLDVRTDDAIDRAYDTGRQAGLTGRLKRWIGHGGPEADIPLEIYPSREAVERRVVAAIAGIVNKEPTEAAIEETTDDIVFRPASPGVELNATESSDLVYRSALSLIEGRDPGVVRLPVREIPFREGAGVTTAILVRIKEQRLYFYENATLSGVYKVSTGTPQFPTPIGNFRVVEKIVNPSWTNPAPDGWGKDMPAYIPPGPNNPLGTRALQLNVPGVLIHGTQNVRALGSPASHGCIRMNMSEIEALFPKVPQGTPVFVRR